MRRGGSYLRSESVATGQPRPIFKSFSSLTTVIDAFYSGSGWEWTMGSP